MADRTDFAGLTRLAPSDPLSADGYRFQDANMTLLDYFIRLLFNPNYDGHVRLPNPTVNPTVTLSDTGGQIPADTTIAIAYTLLDSDGGETAPAPLVSVDTQASLAEPNDAPVLTLNHAAGTLLADTYTYAVTLVDGNGGETALGPPALLTIPPGTATNEIVVSGLSALATTQGAPGWRLWRSIGAEDFHLIATGVAATDTVTDNGSLTADCGVAPPSTTGTTRSTSILHVTVPGGQPAATAQFRLYAGVGGVFGRSSLLGTYPASDLTVVKDFTELALLPGSPPEQSSTMPGFTAPGGGGGSLGDSVRWVVGSAPSISLVESNHFHADQWNPSPSLFNIGQPPNDLTGVPSYLVPKVGTAEPDWHGLVGGGLPMVGDGYIEATFLINNAAAGWDKLGVGWDGLALDHSGIYAVIDHATSELKLVWGAGPLIAAPVPYSGIADGAWATLRLARNNAVAPGVGTDYHGTLTVGKAVIATITGTHNIVTGTPLWGIVLAGWTDPTSFAIDLVQSERSGPHNSLSVEVTSTDGQHATRLLLADDGSFDGGRSVRGEIAGRVLAAGTSPDNSAIVRKTGVGTYDVTFPFALRSPTPVIMTNPSTGVISNRGVSGFTVTFGADTDFEFIAVAAS